MQIAIIGTGSVGAALARGLRSSAHDVTLGTRSGSTSNVEALSKETGASIATPQEAAAAAEVVILALPWAAAESATQALGDLSDKIVIDCMNPLGMVDGQLGLLVGHTTSGGETVQDWLPGARVVKTLNQVGAEHMAENSTMPHRPVMFMAGNDEAAKSVVSSLLDTLGFESLDAGDLTKSRLLEPFAMTWINQAILRGKGRDWAFAALPA